MSGAAKSKIGHGARPAQRCGEDMIELELPGAAAAPAVLSAPRARASVALPDLAADRGRDRLAPLRVRSGLAARVRSAGAAPHLRCGRGLHLARRLHRALALPMRLDGTAY